MNNNQHKYTDINFLGFCERAAYVRDGNTNVFKWNVIGLKNIIISHIFPLNLKGWNVGLAFSSTIERKEHVIKFTDEKGNEIGSLNIFPKESIPEAEDALLKKDGPVMLFMKNGWTPAFFSLNQTNIIVQHPGNYYVNLVVDDESVVIGEIYFAVVDPPPLTPERVAAIQSAPRAYKAVRMEVGCKKCPKKLRAYAALEKNEQEDKDGWTWYQDISDQFTCNCGATTIDTTIIRRNLHGFLGNIPPENLEVSFIPMYEKSAIEDIRSNFAKLLKSNPKEELIQKYIEENTILLHQFPSNQIYFKPPIITFFVADFAIVTPQKELILIEIEKASTNLLLKKGGIAAPLTHAFDQVNDWLHKVDEHRLAILDSLGIDKDLISSVRGVVIAGQEEGYDAKHLRRLKGTDLGRITFLTYDDILSSLDALIRKMSSL